MKKHCMPSIVAVCGILLGSCASQMPTRPTVAVMPGPYIPFEVFQADDRFCRSFAERQINGHVPGKAVAQGTAAGAAVGAGVGAAAGALIGGSGKAAAIGAGTGLLLGAAEGSSRGTLSAQALQRQYDIAYEQCMYSRGNQIPGYPAPATVPPPPPSTVIK